MSSTQLSSEGPSLLEQVLNTNARCFEVIAEHHEITPENAAAYRDVLKMINPAKYMLVNFLPSDNSEHTGWKIPESGSEQYAAFDNYTSARAASLRRLELKLQHTFDDMLTAVPGDCSAIEIQRAWIQPALDIVDEQMCCRIPDEAGCGNIALQCMIAAVKLSAYLIRHESYALVKEWQMAASYLHQIEMMMGLAKVSISFQHVDPLIGKYVATLRVLMNVFDRILVTFIVIQLKESSSIEENLRDACHTNVHAQRMILRIQGILGITA